VTLEGPRWTHPLRLQLAERHTGERLALVGDAACSVHPLAGQGLNLGLKDAAALAETLVDAARLGEDIGGLAVLDRYARRRRFDAATLAMATDGLRRVYAEPNPVLRALRGAGVALAGGYGPARRGLMLQAAERRGRRRGSCGGCRCSVACVSAVSGLRTRFNSCNCTYMAQSAPGPDTRLERAADGQCTGMRVRKLARRVSQIYDAALSGSGLSIGQFGLLGHVVGGREPSMSELAERLVMDRSSLSRALGPLLRAGLVECGPRTGDKRVKVVRATAAGAGGLRGGGTRLAARADAGRRGARRGAARPAARGARRHAEAALTGGGR
jgi:DNA-binding transcriptional ArsR family regulator